MTIDNVKERKRKRKALSAGSSVLLDSHLSPSSSNYLLHCLRLKAHPLTHRSRCSPAWRSVASPVPAPPSPAPPGRWERETPPVSTGVHLAAWCCCPPHTGTRLCDSHSLSSAVSIFPGMKWHHMCTQVWRCRVERKNWKKNARKEGGKAKQGTSIIEISIWMLCTAWGG